MGKDIRMKFLSNEEMQAIKESVWPVCEQMYEMEETDYYRRLSIFNSFVIFKDGDKIIGFISFFLDDIVIDNKSVLLDRSVVKNNKINGEI